MGIAVDSVSSQPPPPPALFFPPFFIFSEARRDTRDSRAQFRSFALAQSHALTERERERMPRRGFSGSLSSPKIDVAIDMGNPFLNRTVDGFLKIGAVGACKVAAEETFECLHRGECACALLSAAIPLPSPHS